MTVYVKGARRSVFCMVCTYRLVSRRLCPGNVLRKMFSLDVFFDQLVGFY